MNGMNCPQCGRPTDWGSTTNEWEYICKPCDARFNRDGLKMPPFGTILRFYGRFGTDVVDARCGLGVDAAARAAARFTAAYL